MNRCLLMVAVAASAAAVTVPAPASSVAGPLADSGCFDPVTSAAVLDGGPGAWRIHTFAADVYRYDAATSTVGSLLVAAGSDGYVVAGGEGDTLTISDSTGATQQTVARPAGCYRRPSWPSAPSATAGGGRTATVVWAAPSSPDLRVDSFTIEISIDGAPFVEFASAESSATARLIDGLPTGVGLRFHVIAVASPHSSEPSAATDSIVLTAAPLAPVAPRAIAGANKVLLTWAPPDDGGVTITDYVVQFSANAGTTWSMSADGVRPQTGATVSGLTNGVAYVFRVAAKNARGTSAWSAKSVLVRPRTRPSAPRTPSGAAKPNAVALSWAAPANGGAPILDYEVFVSSNGGSSWARFADGTSPSTGAIVTSLVNGRSYVFRVRARNAAGAGPYSPTSSRFVPRATVPGQVAGLSAESAKTTILLTWSAPPTGGSPITDYVVQYSSNGGASWTSANDGIRASTGALLRGMTPGRSYIIRVQARNGVGLSKPAMHSVRTVALDPRFATCKALHAAGYTGEYVRGVDPEYAWYRDADKDGIVCEN